MIEREQRISSVSLALAIAHVLGRDVESLFGRRRERLDVELRARGDGSDQAGRSGRA
jgi:DNA-binding XRE family transcriptional regulator